MNRRAFLTAVPLSACAARRAPAAAAPSDEVAPAWPAKTRYRTAEVLGQRIFYREAGDPDRPTLLLLHGFPSSSHTYRELIPLLSGHLHVVAPDYLGSGYSARPDPATEPYTFDRLARHVEGLVDALGLARYVLYLQDFGAPVGFRLMLAQPERLEGLIVQNANAYLDGLTPPRQAFFRDAHDDRSEEAVAGLFRHVSREGVIERQYLRDVPEAEASRMSPDAWTHDLAGLSTEADRAIQVQLFQDYATNLDAYPRWQRFLRERQPPALILWGRRDAAFIPAGAEAYLRDLPDAALRLLDAGHFAVEELPVPIAKAILGFMARL
ncbi:MAG: alpha/beta fold hydrolase [Alphaproteobacteria bacterium]|nr:alpha/beta fold hydrolase [Alphaproteobacteria bacterium]